MKKKIENFKKKAAFIETDDVADVEEKMANDEIAFIKEALKSNEAQIMLLKKENKSDVEEKYLL